MIKYLKLAWRNMWRNWRRTTIAVVAIVLKLIRPQRPMAIPGRAAVLMLATLALAPGVVANLLLKEHWHRPRPIDVALWDINYRMSWTEAGILAASFAWFFIISLPTVAFVPAMWQSVQVAHSLCG